MTDHSRAGKIFCAWVAAALLSGCAGALCRRGVSSEATPLRIAVMDPLSLPLACECVAGYGQRRYDRLTAFLEKTLHRPVELIFVEVLDGRPDVSPRDIDLAIGKFSVVQFDADRLNLKMRTIAMLTDQRGEITQEGLFIVRHADAARSIADLHDHKILFGPSDSDEKNAAALATFEAFDLSVGPSPMTSPGCNQAALAVIEKDADATVVSSYAMPLLSGCGVIRKGELRIVGKTDCVPFIGVFATEHLSPAAEIEVLKALERVQTKPRLLKALESRDGFVALPELEQSSGQWQDWRGGRRDGLSEVLPTGCKVTARMLWSRTLTGPGMAGVSVTPEYIVVADKDLHDEQDVFRCLDADTGRQIWAFAYRADRDMDFTNTPRATPVIHNDRVYLLSAFGQLHCLKLDSGALLWKKNLIEDYSATLPMWGTCSTPLIVDEKLIVNPGAPDASLVALDCVSGETVWAVAGREPGYSSFIIAELGGVRQIVGYDAISLGGWDPQNGKRLWELIPTEGGDYNVPTPIAVDGQLLVSTENNGTRLYSFDDEGKILSTPAGVNMGLAPDTATAIVLDGLIIGLNGGLRCLDLRDGLRELWVQEDDSLFEYGSVMGGSGRILVAAQDGTLIFEQVDRGGYECVTRLNLFDDVAAMDREIWSHPALVGNRLYIRNQTGVYCFLLE